LAMLGCPKNVERETPLWQKHFLDKLRYLVVALAVC